jgi:hypothetical protein
VSRIELLADPFDRNYCYIRRETTVECFQEILLGKVPAKIDARGHLTKCVDARIGAACQLYCHRQIYQCRSREFESLLNCALARLALRAGKLLSLVRDGELQPFLAGLILPHACHIN